METLVLEILTRHKMTDNKARIDLTIVQSSPPVDTKQVAASWQESAEVEERHIDANRGMHDACRI
jgi:hypothetical protein